MKPLPEKIDTPLGEQPFEKACEWWMPAILLWLSHNQKADRTPDGTLTGRFLSLAAESYLDLFMKHVDIEQQPTDKDAITYAVDELNIDQQVIFLRQWRHGELEPDHEFYFWFRDRQSKSEF